ncbi:hypothetical protein [Thalassospira alkalitolerans]|uniref:Uncharacterized protein n=1 Tax=Thalassospira alkalitolerans TaxID=1293890 RepID=A0A1Y2LA35_9PROT|nr:hypothetical protein [Thalassospira alkalitolerans]OSQ46944.1 hypothetical protein TALK_15400 [Thalassospira alkalitolerans]
MIPSQAFKSAASGKSKRPRPAPFSIRLNPDERAYLERRAGKRPLGTYIRSRLLDGQGAARKAVKSPPQDYAALARILGMMGKSEQVSCLFLLLATAEAERIDMPEKERAALHEACCHIQEMRAALISALGLKS